MARRTAVADRHAMLAAYGYCSPTPQQQLLSRGPSPFEQPYASTLASAPDAAAHRAPPYHAKKHDGEDKNEKNRLENNKNSGNGGGNVSHSALSSWWSTSNSGSRLVEQLEEGNDERLQGLSDRVKVLKNITLGIRNEVRESTKDLNSLQEAMSNAGALLGNTFNKMNHMARRQGGWFCNMMLFLFIVFWLFVSRCWQSTTRGLRQTSSCTAAPIERKHTYDRSPGLPVAVEKIVRLPSFLTLFKSQRH